MLRLGRLLTTIASFGAAALAAPAFAQDEGNYGQPSSWQFMFQGAATDIAQQEHAFHNFLLFIITGIVLFVLALIVIVIVRFNERANPTPSRTSHNTLLEVVWTIVPVLILVAIAIPSFRLLYAQYDQPEADITIKATGHQWYWSWEYADGDRPFGFDSLMIQQADLKPGQPRLLAVNNEVVVPLGKLVHVQVTSADVIHAFAMPSFGLKVDAVPGRLNDTWFRANRLGTYYGQCSELCGRDHAFMPIAIRVVSEEDYAVWLTEARQRFAYAPTEGAQPQRVADAAPEAR